VPEIIGEHGGRPVRTRVGHSFIKQTMAETDAVFGGEHSAHYYFRDFWRADSGMLAALHLLAALGTQEASLSQIMAGYDRYAASGEVNSTVADQAAATAAVRAAFADRAEFDELDGLTVALRDGSWFDRYAASGEVNSTVADQAAATAAMAALRDEVLAIVRA
jgi:phosphomannomutase